MSRVAALRELVDEDPGDPFPKYALAMELCKAGAPDEARRWFGRVVDEHPGYVPVYFQLAQLLYDLGDDGAAAASAQAGLAAAREAGDAHAAAELASLLAERG